MKRCFDHHDCGCSGNACGSQKHRHDSEHAGQKHSHTTCSCHTNGGEHEHAHAGCGCCEGAETDRSTWILLAVASMLAIASA